MTRPCNGNHPGRAARTGPYTEDQCRVCWLYLNDRKHHLAMQGKRQIDPNKPRVAKGKKFG